MGDRDLDAYAGLTRRDPQELVEMARQQGVPLAARFEDLMGDFWPEDESIDEFLATLYEWRRGAADARNRPVTGRAQRPLTAADLAALPTELPSGTVRYELWDGELRVLPPQEDVHAAVVATFGGLLFALGEQQRCGCVRVGEGVILGRTDDTVVGADVVFLTNDQLPPRRSREDYLETTPALIVEVRSKNDTATDITDKVAAYLAAGARAVWVADPARRTVFVHRPGQQPFELRPGDTLTADDLIPRFTVPIADLFAGLE